MRHQLINGESIEIERLDDQPDEDLRIIWVSYAVTFFDLHDNVVAGYRWRGRETHAMRRQGRRLKQEAPERILAGMRLHPEIAAGGADRMAAIQDLFGHLRRHRLGRARKLH